VLEREEISEERVEWAVEVAQLSCDLETFPKGLDTFVGTRGMALSGGQKQRLGLARALAGTPQLLILDDCTSALDSHTEAALWERLHAVLPGLTAVFITHRPDTLRHADRIYVLDKGKIVESGSHDSLLGKEGLYNEIYSQYELEEVLARDKN